MKAELGTYLVEIATDFGPRITSLRLGDGPEQLAWLGEDTTLDHESGPFRFRGGHRLWAAPEDSLITYAPDDHECTVQEVDGGVTVAAPPDAAGLVKEMTVRVDEGTLVVDHRITGSGTDLRVAPWAITQLPLWGTAILPVIGAETGPSANRYLVMWPYASIEDRRVTLCDDVLEIEAEDGPQLKFGVGPRPGMLGYFKEGVVFLKEVEAVDDRVVPDFGAAGQIYVGQGFCELESVGGLTDLSNGGEAVLRERWTVRDCADIESAIEMVLSS